MKMKPKAANSIENRLLFCCCGFVDKETKTGYDNYVDKETKIPLLRGEFKCLNLDHIMYRRKNKQ